MFVETTRLIIDDIKESDKENYFINISHDKEVLKTFVCRYQESLEDFDFSQYPGRNDLFAIRTKETGELIGIFVICEENPKKKEMEIGYGIGSKHWGKGYMTEVVNGVLNYFFNHDLYNTIYASFFPENEASKRIMEKCNMTYSHTNYKEFTYLDRERDLIYYKITKS